MWVFGYGSLMSDGWEREYGCEERQGATLTGYERAFNKRSVVNWGTGAAPGITLNLAARDNAACSGIAFRFAEGEQLSLLGYLRKREGCQPAEVSIDLNDGRRVAALAYIYTAANLLSADVSLSDRAAMVLKASGTSGQNRDYVQRTFDHLSEIGVDDPAVTELWNAVAQT